jgi:catechol 2,3-dioxygenase-like lactoylglutathione lyase family enzyme
MTMVRGFSHVGVSTHEMDTTIHFYEDLLGFPRVVEELTHVNDGGTLRQVYFDVGHGQFIVFMEPKNVPGIASHFDAGINGALGVPRGMYHYALNVPTVEDLELLHSKLQAHGVEASAIIDLGHAKSLFFRDPNGIQLEFCCQTRPFSDLDLHRVSQATIASS